MDILISNGYFLFLILLYRLSYIAEIMRSWYRVIHQSPINHTCHICINISTLQLSTSYTLAWISCNKQLVCW